MEVIKVEGIVVKAIDYKESSKILTLYTRDYGKISVISKGCKSKTSKLRAFSNLFSYGTFYLYYKKDGLSTLTSVDLINSFSNLIMDIYRISYATYILELVLAVTKDRDYPDVYDLLINSLIKMNDGFDPLIITYIIELKCLKYLGVSPNLDSCVICSDNRFIKTLSIEKGGFVCSNCYQNEYLFSEKFIKVIRILYYVDLSKVNKIEISSSTKNELDLFINEYYDKYTGIYLKSREFLKNLKKLG